MVEVVGVPDAHYGEIVVAFIIPKLGATLSEDGVKDYCSKLMAKFKVPKYVFFVRDYPKTGSGKVQKFKLRELGKQLVDEILEKQKAASKA